MNKKLFIPGLIDVREDVLQKISVPMMGHRGKETSQLQKSISEKFQGVFYTASTILLSTSSGTGLMKWDIRSYTSKKTVMFSSGSFGDRWCNTAVTHNETSTGIRNPIEEIGEVLKNYDYDYLKK